MTITFFGNATTATQEINSCSLAPIAADAGDSFLTGKHSKESKLYLDVLLSTPELAHAAKSYQLAESFQNPLY